MEEYDDNCVEFTPSQYITIYNLRLEQNLSKKKVNAICLLKWRSVNDWQDKH